MTEEEPRRYKMGMKPGFAQKYARDKVIGSPFRASVGDDVVITGVVINWVDEVDGGVTLVIEQRDF